MTREVRRTVGRPLALPPRLLIEGSPSEQREAVLRILDRGDEITRWLLHSHEEDAWMARVEIQAGLRGAGIA